MAFNVNIRLLVKCFDKFKIIQSTFHFVRPKVWRVLSNINIKTQGNMRPNRKKKNSDNISNIR